MKLNKPSLKILITAGPTREYIDPVRFISNASTGTIGYLMADVARKRGHEVILLSGPTHLKPPNGVKTEHFVCAFDLKKKADKFFDWADCVICSSAVGDYRPGYFSPQKIKKTKNIKKIILKKNPDILKSLGEKKKNKILVGFALETDNLDSNALKKMKEKNLDLIIANKLSKTMNPFGDNRTSVTLIDNYCYEKIKNITKRKLARIIIDRVEKLCYIF